MSRTKSKRKSPLSRLEAWRKAEPVAWSRSWSIDSPNFVETDFRVSLGVLHRRAKSYVARTLHAAVSLALESQSKKGS